MRAGESKLNDLESEIMRYIIELRDDIDDVTLKSVAERFFVAPNTIVRLAHKLGFSGFTELKQSYSASLDRNRFTIEALPLDTQLVQTKDLLNDRVIDSVVSLIQDASHIVFFCSGFSKYPCLEMAEKLKIMGKNTDTLSERHVMRHYAELLGKNDLVFSVSVSGETQVSIDATSIAKTRGCKVVTLTGFSRNSLSKLADYPIYTVQKEIRLGSMDLDSRLMFYYVFELIFERYFKLAKKYNLACVRLRPFSSLLYERYRPMQRVLFICHGNICRSTMAESVFTELVRRAGRAGEFVIDSAATSTEEIGNPPHHGTVAKLREVGIPVVAHRARQVRRAEYGDWDRIVYMDAENARGLRRIFGDDPDGRITRLLDWTDRPGDVADPWYTGNFDATYRDVLAGCAAMLEQL